MATLDSLQREINELKAWKAQREAQQITFPIDEKSLTILNKYFLTKSGILEFVNASGQVSRIALLKQDGRTEAVGVYDSLPRYTVDVSSNEIIMGLDIVNLGKGSFSDDQQVLLLTTGAHPAPFADAVVYYVVNANSDGTVFQLSATSGGSAINITDTGSGEQYMYLLT